MSHVVFGEDSAGGHPAIRTNTTGQIQLDPTYDLSVAMGGQGGDTVAGVVAAVTTAQTYEFTQTTDTGTRKSATLSGTYDQVTFFIYPDGTVREFKIEIDDDGTGYNTGYIPIWVPTTAGVGVAAAGGTIPPFTLKQRVYKMRITPVTGNVAGSDEICVLFQKNRTA